MANYSIVRMSNEANYVLREFGRGDFIGLSYYDGIIGGVDNHQNANQDREIR